MIPQARTKSIAIAVVALLAVSVLGYWGYSVYKERELRKAVIAMLEDTSQRVRGALKNEASAQLASIPGTVSRLEAHAAEIDRDYTKLRRMDSSAVRELREAADGYLLTGREILRRLAAIHRSRIMLAESKQAILDHMGSDRGAASWPRDAVRAKERIDQDYREYKLAAAALAKVLQSFPGSQAKIAPHAEAGLVIDGSLVSAARKRVLEDSEQRAAEIKKITDLDTYR